MKAGGLNGGPGLPKATQAGGNGSKPHQGETLTGPHKNGAHAKAGQAFQPDGRAPAKVDLFQRALVVAPRWEASDQFASFQTDAPACDNCGAITVRNGNCYLCHNCGNSMGCS